MKAKHYNSLRIKCNYYQVECTGSLFVSFDYNFKGSVILARNHKEAAKRYRKRYGTDRHQADNETTSQWGRYKVKLQTAPDHHRHFKYFN
jgi:hypothetical protein